MMKNEVKQGCPICGEIHGPRGLVFDGKGVNGCDGFRSRLATFESKAPDAVVKKLGNLFAAAPELLDAVKTFMQLSNNLAAALTPEQIADCTGDLSKHATQSQFLIAKAERGDK